MEKPTAKSKNKILRFLPKAAQAAVSFQNPPFSPARDKRPDKLRTQLSKGFSGPIVSMIPAEARRKSKNFETQEPTSPKVSCMGQIKHKNRICKQRHASLPKEFRPAFHSQPDKISKIGPSGPAAPELKRKPSGIKKLFGAGRKSHGSIDYGKPPIPDRAPSLSQMRRFASSRDTLAKFDWTTAQIAPEDQDPGFYSEEDKGYSDGEDDVIIPFSAPILVGGGLALEPRKEINLWKRRTMAQPKPLQLNMVRAQ
ncbi:hypothetical protein DH2020_007413 [Rehmannia glutinosa]|uniref:Syringolide-induced protein 14-1-1 n=1 Tax=Rehmannia glutinosa TaxID=99300 RepID=A0ABR0TY34_REHGL